MGVLVLSEARMSPSPRLDLQVVMNHQTRMLEIKLGFSAEAVCTCDLNEKFPP